MGHTRRYYKNKKRNKTKNKHIRFKHNLAIENKKRDLNFHKEFVPNLSKRDITETEFKVIAKGLKFVPTNKCNHRQLIKDFQSFERSLLLKYYFGTNVRIATKIHPFKIKSNFQVPIIGDNSIEKYIFYTKHELSKYMPKIKYNMSKSERECIKKLKIDNTICIHKADKNNTTVIQNKRDYLTEGESQLNDGIHYTKIINIDIENTRKIVNKMVYRMKENDEIDEMSFKFLREEGKTVKTPKAYFLPKIHKLSTETLEMYQNKCMNKEKVHVPGRPIISQCSGPLLNIGKYLDYFLLPLVKTQDTYLSDTSDFIRYIENTHTEQSDLLFPMI